MDNSRNENGLVDGLIPIGEECPFLEVCNLRVDNCPSIEQGNLRVERGFSCAAARGFSLTAKYRK